MTWYAANLISVVRVRAGIQQQFPVWEDVLLIEAGDDTEAQLKALELGKKNESDDPSMTYNGAPAHLQFLGVRKVVRIVNPFPAPPDETPPVSGTEITYSKFLVSTEDALKDIVEGNSVTLRYDE